MAIRLMYITNNPQIAKIAEKTGVDRVFIDMEYIGKEKRQAGLDSVKSHHTIEDIRNVRKVINKSELLVRVNPIHEATTEYGDSYDEINAVIDAGADVLMLPMYKSVAEVEKFLRIVNGRAKTQLLTETPEAHRITLEVVQIPEVDEIHIGLNDLHLAYKKNFMFELLADGTVDEICKMIKTSNKKYGFGGIARIGYGLLPAEYIIREHYRLGSTCAILSRAFCNANKIDNTEEIEQLFAKELVRIRKAEVEASQMTAEEFLENHKEVRKIVNNIVAVERGLRKC